MYAYKLVIDGVWTLDPGNPRTRSSGGNRNSVVTVGGMAEPLLFAPGSPFVDDLDGGGVRVVVGVRKGGEHEEALPILRYAEHDGDPLVEVPMARLDEEDEHVFYAARVPGSARVRYSIALRTRAGESQGSPTFVHERPAARDLAPAWWREALVYTIYVDRFRPARDHEGWDRDPGKNVRAGGHLEGIRRSLGGLADLGATVLYLTPVHVAASSHRYDFVDPFEVDLTLGGAPAFDALIEDAHARDIRVLMDVSFSHAGLAFPQCADVLAHGRASQFADWFVWDGPALKHYGRRRDAPLVNLEHPGVQEMVLRAVEGWARRGVDGLRMDMAAEVPLPLAREIRRRFLLLRPEGVVLGELVPAHAWRWLSTGALDAATDFGFHGIITDLIAHRAITPRLAMARLAASDRARGSADHTKMRFVSTHDHPRLMSLAHAGGRGAEAFLAHVLLATMPGVPALLYGEEIGMRAPYIRTDPENVWGDRAPMPWTTARDEDLRARLKGLFAVRRSSPALLRGELRVLHADDRLLVYRRERDGDVVDVLLNLGETIEALEIADDELPGIDPLVRAGIVELEGETVRLGPGSAVVVRRARPAASVARPRTRLNVLARDREFSLARTVTESLPTRIDFAVTERCNLRCEHCITFAPARTQGGTARTMTPWVLDRLRPALANASYFGFVHGGESMTAPIFFDVLGAIRDERRGDPHVVHLLTNGVLLTRATTGRLLDLDVSSISVSLDGATEATNDAIRTGGRFELIVKNLRDVAKLRKETTANLRLGISYVIMSSNLHELSALVDLAASVGVDWIKLEEAVPVNAFAKRSLVALPRTEVEAAVGKAVARAKSLGIVVVNHTVDRTIWRCKLTDDPEMAAFVEADEFANRSEINTCRAPWEVACVEPNGDVRGGHFFGPILGNIALQDLRELWNGPVAQEERVRSHMARICGPAGPVTCIIPYTPGGASTKP